MGTVMRYLTGFVKIKTRTCIGARQESCHGQVQAELRPGHWQGKGMGKGKARVGPEQGDIIIIIRHCASA